MAKFFLGLFLFILSSRWVFAEYGAVEMVYRHSQWSSLLNRTAFSVKTLSGSNKVSLVEHNSYEFSFRSRFTLKDQAGALLAKADQDATFPPTDILFGRSMVISDEEENESYSIRRVNGLLKRAPIFEIRNSNKVSVGRLRKLPGEPIYVLDDAHEYPQGEIEVFPNRMEIRFSEFASSRLLIGFAALRFRQKFVEKVEKGLLLALLLGYSGYQLNRWRKEDNSVSPLTAPPFPSYPSSHTNAEDANNSVDGRSKNHSVGFEEEKQSDPSTKERSDSSSSQPGIPPSNRMTSPKFSNSHSSSSDFPSPKKPSRFTGSDSHPPQQDAPPLPKTETKEDSGFSKLFSHVVEGVVDGITHHRQKQQQSSREPINKDPDEVVIPPVSKMPTEVRVSPPTSPIRRPPKPKESQDDLKSPPGRSRGVSRESKEADFTAEHSIPPLHPPVRRSSRTSVTLPQNPPSSPLQFGSSSPPLPPHALSSTPGRLGSPGLGSPFPMGGRRLSAPKSPALHSEGNLDIPDHLRSTGGGSDPDLALESERSTPYPHLLDSPPQTRTRIGSDAHPHLPPSRPNSNSAPGSPFSQLRSIRPLVGSPVSQTRGLSIQRANSSGSMGLGFGVGVTSESTHQPNTRTPNSSSVIFGRRLGGGLGSNGSTPKTSSRTLGGKR